MSERVTVGELARSLRSLPANATVHVEQRDDVETIIVRDTAGVIAIMRVTPSPPGALPRRTMPGNRYTGD